ncbi:MAG: hypothetical protein JRG97_14465 [Deltaproteobacteria bacterium]|nr:hypothetical protein [Deltaproteobacteria bacterium]MBW2142246.1 hypothetical protein [Deltaproteobacteria bacterium]MBW2324299.1 hypothetical protein [Deltaproteobacteria bacterium]
MPRKKIVNAGALINAVESGLPSKAIMAKFGVKTSAQLKSFYLDALAEKGKVKGIISRTSRQSKGAKKKKGIKVNKRGSLIVSREIIEEMGFKIGDFFAVRKTKAGASLKKV